MITIEQQKDLIAKGIKNYSKTCKAIKKLNLYYEADREKFLSLFGTGSADSAFISYTWMDTAARDNLMELLIKLYGTN